jgi:hypothetical protein
VREPNVSTKTSVSAADVRSMLEGGVGRTEIVRQLIETGVWSRAGALEIVKFMTDGPDPLLKTTLPLPPPKHVRTRRHSNHAEASSWAAHVARSHGLV